MPSHEIAIRPKPLRMPHRTIEDSQMRRVTTAPLLQILPIAMETRTARFTNRLAVSIEILQKAQPDRTRLIGVIPQVLHAVHQRLLEIAFVGLALRVVALRPPLAAP